MLEKEIEITAATDLNYLERKNIQLRGEIQCLNDRIAGLVKENDTLKREATIRKAIVKVIDTVRNIWNSLKPKIAIEFNPENSQKLE
jgi:hypothetical protein